MIGTKKDANTPEKPFFHEVSDEKFEELSVSKVSWGDIIDTFKQPDWCSYPTALGGMSGCWSLTKRIIKDQSQCQTCPARI
jgi:hypothetical protein